MEQLKLKLRATWTAGDFAEIAKAIEEGAIEFVDRLALKRGKRVLDVACGNGNTVIPAARAGADVTGIDIAPYLIQQALIRTAEAGVKAEFDIGDAESMPYDDESFDVVLTMFGAMFAPQPDVTATELKRVCKSGGTIAMANWTPQVSSARCSRRPASMCRHRRECRHRFSGAMKNTVTDRFAEETVDLQMVRRKIDFDFLMNPAKWSSISDSTTVRHRKRSKLSTKRVKQRSVPISNNSGPTTIA
jgi:ubiquinone/menaquinone biosynthesis C-methylase UbiE